jgi:branched-chain amino acid transport system ATP-binding protein
LSALLEVEQLHVRIGGRSLLEIDELCVDVGALAVIVGDAGGGKTLLAAALVGDIDSAGQVRVDGRTLAGPPSRRGRAGLAASVRDGQRVTGCTVREALQLAAHGGRRAGEALERIPQLGTRAELLAQLLSGGEQQLLQVACAWCTAPRVLVLDSPTVGLAADAAAIVSALAFEEAAAGTSVLWLEQDRREAPKTTIGVLIKGRWSQAPGVVANYTATATPPQAAAKPETAVESPPFFGVTPLSKTVKE